MWYQCWMHNISFPVSSMCMYSFRYHNSPFRCLFGSFQSFSVCIATAVCLHIRHLNRSPFCFIYSFPSSLHVSRWGPFNYYVTLWGGRPGVTLCDRGRGSAERYVTPKIIYMYNIYYYNFYCYVCLFFIYTYLYMYYYKHLYIYYIIVIRPIGCNCRFKL